MVFRDKMGKQNNSFYKDDLQKMSLSRQLENEQKQPILHMLFSKIFEVGFLYKQLPLYYSKLLSSIPQFENS